MSGFSGAHDTIRDWNALMKIKNSRQEINRRTALTAGSVGALSMLNWKLPIIANAAQIKANAKSCILLWMGGGPSQFETWDPKSGHSNGGETQSVQTSIPGVNLAMGLKETASIADELCIIRSMNGPEGSHPRASYVTQTGYLPTASVKYPAIGSHVAQHLGDADANLPSFVRIGNTRNTAKAGLLGVDFDPFLLSSAERLPDNTQIQTTESRYKRRLGLLNQLEDDASDDGSKKAVIANRKLYGKASRMILSPEMDAFDLSKESPSSREAYGDGSFAAGCLMARRLVETGVTFVEVASSNWDTHFDNFSRTTDLCTEVDLPFAQLVRDLKQRGMLDSTLVVWLGEFGRTPRINGRGGRDHYPRAYSMAMAGCGIKGGQVIGQTDDGGVEITDRPVKVNDLLHTLYTVLGVEPEFENLSSIGRPIKIVENGSLIDGVM